MVKIILLLSLSFSALADVNSITGSFESEDSVKSHDLSSAETFGFAHGDSRTPASVEKSEQEDHVTEITGTFK